MKLRSKIPKFLSSCPEKEVFLRPFFNNKSTVLCNFTISRLNASTSPSGLTNWCRFKKSWCQKPPPNFFSCCFVPSSCYCTVGHKRKTPPSLPIFFKGLNRTRFLEALREVVPRVVAPWEEVRVFVWLMMWEEQSVQQKLPA